MTFPATFYTIDILFFIFIVLFGIAGFSRGLSEGLARLLAFLFLLFGFCFLYPSVAQLAIQKWSTIPADFLQILLALILFFAGITVFFVLRILFQRFLKDIIPELVDNVVGTVAGALFGLLIGISALSLVTMVPHDSAYQTLSEESLVGAWVCGSVVPWLHPRMLELPMFDQE